MDWHSHGCNLPVLDGHALLLVKTRFLRPRNSRGESAICPGKWPRRCPQPRSGRDQSATANVSAPRPVRDLDQSEAVTAAASANCPCSIAQMAANHPQPVRSRVEAERVNQRRDCMSPVVASISCSPCRPSALQIDPPPGSGDLLL